MNLVSRCRRRRRRAKWFIENANEWHSSERLATIARIMRGLCIIDDELNRLFYYKRPTDNTHTHEHEHAEEKKKKKK